MVRLSPHPVLLVRPVVPRARWLGRILVPLDGSAAAESILPWVIVTAQIFTSEVVLVRVDATTPRASEAYLESVATRFREAGLPVRTAVLAGDPAGAIVDAAETFQAGLIAMTSHGQTGPDRWLLGSVADRVVHASPIPVLLVRVEEG